jgi:hypothetical protein
LVVAEHLDEVGQVVGVAGRQSRQLNIPGPTRQRR